MKCCFVLFSYISLTLKDLRQSFTISEYIWNTEAYTKCDVLVKKELSVSSLETHIQVSVVPKPTDITASTHIFYFFLIKITQPLYPSVVQKKRHKIQLCLDKWNIEQSTLKWCNVVIPLNSTTIQNTSDASTSVTQLINFKWMITNCQI